ncbi:riboflavin synthase [Georgenia alba]|uniref:Riboflavin synthase n=1 Tax=Georgenia alba TaxID=2233858 RepID=A0ABW2QFH3_9MICO
MFTGLVEEVGTVIRRVPESDVTRLRVAATRVTADLRVGDSVAVAGVCLTVTDHDRDGFAADVVPETLERTTLGRLAAGDRVNLERAVRADGRLGGHVVTGHVDGVGTLVARTPGRRWDDVALEVPDRLSRYVAEKGSIAVEGVSLTVAGVAGNRVEVALVPTTLAATTLGDLPPGAAVNVEVDVLAKYVERLVHA